MISEDGQRERVHPLGLLQQREEVLATRCGLFARSFAAPPQGFPELTVLPRECPSSPAPILLRGCGNHESPPASIRPVTHASRGFLEGPRHYDSLTVEH